MNRLLVRSLSCFRHYNPLTPSASRFQRVNLSQLNFQNSRRFLSSSIEEDTKNAPALTSEDHEEEQQSQIQSEIVSPPPIPSQQRESVNDRLLRLSSQSPDEFEPTLDPDETERLRWEKYANYFPDQYNRTTNPNQRGAPTQYNNQRGGYMGGMRGSYSNPNIRQPREFNPDSFRSRSHSMDNNNYNRPSRSIRNMEDEDDEEADFNQDLRSTGYRQDASRRYNGRFESDWVTKKEQAPRQSRGGRISSEGELEEEKPLNYKKMMNKYDLEESDLPEEPRQSSDTRFTNNENRDAIREAYLKKFKAGGTAELKRNFHSYAPLRFLQGSASADEAVKLPSSAELMKNQVSDDPDTFGTLNSTHSVDSIDNKRQFISSTPITDETLEDDSEEDDATFRPQDRMSFRKMKINVVNLLKEKKLTEALDLFTAAMKEGGMRYQKSDLEYVYRTLISESGKAGHVKMAFKLHAHMKKRGLWIKPAVYTSLFNACSNATWIASECKIRMSYLREQMERKGYQPNLINYHAMIKAYGRCGDLDEAYAIVDEMVARRDRLVRPVEETFNFLLQACISDTQNGFRNALITWDKMRKMRIRPSIYSYNLLLRATRECSVQIPDDIQRQVELRRSNRRALLASVSNEEELEVAKEITSNSIVPEVVQAKMVAMDTLTVSNLARLQECVSLITSEAFETNAGAKILRTDKKNKITLPDQVLDAVQMLADPTYRLLILGGMRGVLEQMSRDGVDPNLITLQECLMLCRPLEIWDTVKVLDEFKIQPTVGFFNVLIRKLVLCHRLWETKKAVQLMNDRRVSPDIYTWSALALACTTWDAAKELLANIDAANFTISAEVVGAFCCQATRCYDPLYIVHLMDLLDREGIPASALFLDSIEQFNQTVREAIIQMEKGQPVVNPIMKNKLKADPEGFLKEYKHFRTKYSHWIHETPVEVEPEDPWSEDFAARFPPKRKEEDGSS